MLGATVLSMGTFLSTRAVCAHTRTHTTHVHTSPTRVHRVHVLTHTPRTYVHTAHMFTHTYHMHGHGRMCISYRSHVPLFISTVCDTGAEARGGRGLGTVGLRHPSPAHLAAGLGCRRVCLPVSGSLPCAGIRARRWREGLMFKRRDQHADSAAPRGTGLHGPGRPGGAGVSAGLQTCGLSSSAPGGSRWGAGRAWGCSQCSRGWGLVLHPGWSLGSRGTRAPFGLVTLVWAPPHCPWQVSLLDPWSPVSGGAGGLFWPVVRQPTPARRGRPGVL